MSIETLPPFGDTPLSYRQIDAALPVGGITLAHCIALREGSAAATPTPDRLYEYAWLGLEMTLAMVRTPNPETEQPFPLKAIDQSGLQAQGEFGNVVRHELAPPLLQAQARIAGASVGLYREATSGRHMQGRSKQFIPYLRALQTAARTLLNLPEHSPEEAHFLQVMTTIALLSEYTDTIDFILPAAPRQPWDINRIRKHNGSGSRLAVGRTDLPGIDVVAIADLGHQMWNDNDPYATLAAYVGQPAGFVITGTKNPSREHLTVLRTSYSLTSTVHTTRRFLWNQPHRKAPVRQKKTAWSQKPDGTSPNLPTTSSQYLNPLSAST